MKSLKFVILYYVLNQRQNSFEIQFGNRYLKSISHSNATTIERETTSNTTSWRKAEAAVEKRNALWQLGCRQPPQLWPFLLTVTTLSRWYGRHLSRPNTQKLFRTTTRTMTTMIANTKKHFTPNTREHDYCLNAITTTTTSIKDARLTPTWTRNYSPQ